MKSRMHVKILCAAVLMCGAATVLRSAAAQDAPPPPMPERSQGTPDGPGPGGPGRGQMDPARRLQMMKQRLGLSDAQTAQVKAVMDDERTKAQTIMSAQSGDREANRAKFDAIRKDSETRIAAILTPDQKAKWEEMRSRQRGRGPGAPPDGNTPPPPPQQ